MSTTPSATPTDPGKFFDTLTRTVRPLELATAGRVGVYACGPTVYDTPHIGNYRYFVWIDLLHRYLRSCGLEVEMVMNITDIDDRTIDGAQRAGLELDAYTAPFIERFLDGLALLDVLPASHYPRATEHVAQMIDLIGRLLAGEHAYVVDGNVFFRVASFPGYGKLSRRDPEEMRATERVAGDDFAKEDARDFALWKATAADEPGWDAPFGRGRPGWHLECSAMSMEFLGETFDLHCGGIDLSFPHHENEIAQSEAATGKPFARFWMHCQHLIVDGTKMSKSLGNFYTLDDLLEQGHSPAAIRYLLVSAHYRTQLNFTQAGLTQAESSLERLREVQRRLAEVGGEPSDDDRSAASGSDGHDLQLTAALEVARSGFAAALADDLNTAAALGCVFTFVREANATLDAGAGTEASAAARADAAAACAWFDEVSATLGLSLAEERTEIVVTVDGATVRGSGPCVDAPLAALIERRTRARLARDFATADALRDELRGLGVDFEDTADGFRWKLRS